MSLSDERKRQIREEEEAKYRAARKAEEQYREQVRRELEGRPEVESSQPECERVVEEGPVQSQSDEVSACAPAPSHIEPTTSITPRLKAPRPMAGLMALVLVLGGMTCTAFAFRKGFVLPFTGPPPEITLTVDSAGDFELVAEELPSDESTTPHAASTSSAVSAAPGPTPSSPDSPGEPPATGSARPPKPTAKRATLKGTGISIEVPTGWRVEPSDFDDMLEIRWRGSGVTSGHEEVVAYLLLQKSDLLPGEDVGEFAERLMEEFLDAVGPDDDIDLERDTVIRDFHGVVAFSIDVVSEGFMPYRMRNLYFVKDGQGYMLTCYATAGSFEDRAPTFNRMLDSMRF